MSTYQQDGFAELLIGKIGKAAVLEQLAEEAAELAHAALKCARISRGDNYTPLPMGEAIGRLREEIADVSLCMDVVGGVVNLELVPEIKEAKLERWLGRLGVDGNGEQ